MGCVNLFPVFSFSSNLHSRAAAYNCCVSAMRCQLWQCGGNSFAILIIAIFAIVRLRGVMFNVLASSVVDRGFKSRSDQIKDNQIGICCFSTKHAVFRSNSKDWLTRNQDNVFEWSDISAHKLLFSEQIHVDPIKGAGLVQSGHYYHLIEYTKMYLVLAP